MRGEPLSFDAQVRVAAIGWPRQRSGLLDASVGPGPEGVAVFVPHAQPVGVRR